MGQIPYDTLDEMFEIIKKKCQKVWKNIFMLMIQNLIILCMTMDQIQRKPES